MIFQAGRSQMLPGQTVQVVSYGSFGWANCLAHLVLITTGILLMPLCTSVLILGNAEKLRLYCHMNRRALHSRTQLGTPSGNSEKFQPLRAKYIECKMEFLQHCISEFLNQRWVLRKRSRWKCPGFVRRNIRYVFISAIVARICGRYMNGS